MITTYSYLDQYKQMGDRAALDYFTVISIRETPHSMKLRVSDACALSHAMYPSDLLYPADTLYPDNGIADIELSITGGGS